MDQVQEVKQKTSIAEVVGNHVALKKKGRNLVGLCPFHSEKTGSFMVNEELQIYKCFGCGEAGDVYKFLMEVEGLDFAEALEKLADKAGVKLIKLDRGRQDSKHELLEIHHLAGEYYHYLLTKHPSGETAREYLRGRGISEKLSETFNLGFALPEWEGLVKYLVQKKGYKAEQLIAGGLAVGSVNRIYDRFRGRVMFPLLDISGRVVGFSGRVLPGAKEEEPKYTNSPETEIYHKSKMLFGLTTARNEIKKKNRVVIVEGELDMISSFAAGVTETVAIKGSALTGEMMDVLSRLTNTFILAMDADAAGEAAMKRSIEESEKRGLSIKMVEIVGGKDPDEIARKKPREWVEMVEKAVPVYEYFFTKAIGRYGTSGVENIFKIVKEVVPYLAKVENNVIREVWAKKLAEKLGVEKQRVWEEIEKIRTGRGPGREEKLEATSGGSRQQLDQDFIGHLMLANPELTQRVKKSLIGLPLTGAAGKIIGLLFDRDEDIKPEDFVRSLPEELRDLAQGAYMALEREVVEEKELLKLALDWAKKVIREERNLLTGQIKGAEEGGEMAHLGILSEKLVKLNTLEKKLVLN